MHIIVEISTSLDAYHNVYLYRLEFSNLTEKNVDNNKLLELIRIVM